MMSNLFELKYVLNKELLKILIGKVDAQLLKADTIQQTHIQHNTGPTFSSHKLQTDAEILIELPRNNCTPSCKRH